jgi:uncharacterized membrane protein HdeD (DUF308 family)
MAQYSEVPEWAYLALTVFAIVLGCVGLTAYPTNASVSSIFFGIFLCIVSVLISHQSRSPELNSWFLPAPRHPYRYHHLYHRSPGHTQCLC